MALKMTLWLCALMFVAMVYNGISAYKAMGSADIQKNFQRIGLITQPQNQVASIE